MRPHRSAPLALGAALLAVAGSAGAQAGERHTLRADDRGAAVWNLAGTVKVVAGTGRDVVVEVVRRGADAGKLRVETGEVRGTNAVRVVYPDDDIVYPALGGRSQYRTRLRADGTWGGDGGGFFSSEQIQVRGSGRGTEAWAEVTAAVPAGARFRVHLAVGEATVQNVDGHLSIDVDAASVTSERTRGTLSIDAGSGRVRVLGAQGDVDLDLGSGSVELRDVSANRLAVDGGSGNVTGTNVTAATAEFDLGSGSTRLANVSTKSISVDAGSGTVDLDFATDVDDVNIDTGSGGITLRVPPTLGATVDIETNSGGIDSEVPIQVSRKERDHLRGQIGDGRGRIVIEAGSGSVRILKR